MSERLKLPASCQLLADLNTGGVEKATVEITQALVKSGARVVVVSDGGRMLPGILRAGASHIRLPVDGRSSWTMIQHGWKISRLLKQEKLTVIDLKTPSRAASALLARRIWPAKLIVTAHGLDGGSVAERRRFRDAIAKADRVVAVSDFIAGRIRKEIELDDGKIAVIPPGIDLATFNPAVVKIHRIIDLARKWRLPDGVPLIIVPSRLTPEHGQAFLIETLAAMKEVAFTCLLLGDETINPAFRKDLERLVSRHNLGGHVRFVGFCDDMPAAYMLADVIVAPASKPEGFSRVLVEAQAMGRPVVAAEYGSTPELVMAGETGWLHRPGNSESLKSGLAAALGMTAEARSELALKARDHVSARYTAARMCQDTLTLYAALAG